MESSTMRMYGGLQGTEGPRAYTDVLYLALARTVRRRTVKTEEMKCEGVNVLFIGLVQT